MSSTFSSLGRPLPVQMSLILGLLFVVPCACLFAQTPPQQKVLSTDQAWAALKDDDADPERWVTAAKAIVLPLPLPNVPLVRLNSPLPAIGIMSGGEPLRTQVNPSVSDLLIKRMNSTFDLALQPDQLLFRVQEATLLAEALADWDGKKHLPDLVAFSDRLAHIPVVKMEYGPILAKDLLEILAKRVDLLDPSAVASLIDFISSDQNSRSDLTILAYLWQRPNNPLLADAADQFFIDKSAGWGPIIELNGQFAAALNSPLMGISYFRRAVIKGLKDTDEILEPRPSEIGDLAAHYGITYKLGDHVGDLPIELRICDLYAMGISEITEAPDFNPIWPTAQKDLAIEKIVTFLNIYGNAYQYREPDSQQNEYSSFGRVTDRAKFHLDQLDHPATAADVQSGKAIFSLTPARSKLIRLNRVPITISKIDSASGQPMVLNIWQEESLVDQQGAAHKMCGYTGNHEMGICDESTLDATAQAQLVVAQTPIPTPTPIPSPLLSINDRELAWVISPTVSGIVESLKKEYVSGTPIQINFKLKNSTAQIVPLPPDFNPTPDKKTIPIGLTLETELSKDDKATGVWKALQMKTLPPSVSIPSPVSPPVAPIMIPANGEHVLGGCDLTALYDLSKPGNYRLKIGNPGSDTGVIMLFTIKNK